MCIRCRWQFIAQRGPTTEALGWQQIPDYITYLSTSGL